jgi:hypothetical protein
MGTVLHLRTINRTTEPRSRTIFIWQRQRQSQVETAGKVSLGCPWVGKLRTVLLFTN